MATVLADRGAELLTLFFHLGGVAVVETVRRMLHPEPGEHGQAKRVGAVEEVFAVHLVIETLGAPGADGGRAEGGCLLEELVTAHAADGVGRAVAEPLPATVGVLRQCDLGRECRSHGAEGREEAAEAEALEELAGTHDLGCLDIRLDAPRGDAAGERLAAGGEGEIDGRVRAVEHDGDDRTVGVPEGDRLQVFRSAG